MSLLTAVLVIASLASIGMMMQTNNAAAAAAAAAAGNTIFKAHFSQNSAFAAKTIQEGNITTTAGAVAFKNTVGDSHTCVFMSKRDVSTGGTFLTDFEGCGSLDQLTVANNLGSATFSGTVTGYDYISEEEKTVTVNVDLTATGKVQTETSSFRDITPDLKIVINENGHVRPASGSLNISGDLTFSADDASGHIAKVREGFIDVEKV